MTDVNEQIPSYSFSFLHDFFFLELSCVTSFFFSFHAFFFLFSSSSLFGVWLFSFFFLGGAEFVLLVFGLFSLFLIFFFFSFRCWTFLLFLSDWCRICSSCFWPFFFLGVELCCFFFFFFFSFHAFLLFWGWWCAVLLLFSVLDIFLFLSGGGCRICSSCFWSLFLVSYFLGALCFLSLSLLRSPEQAAPKQISNCS